MQRQRRQQARGVRPSQARLVAEEEHGLRSEGQELYRGSEGLDPKGDDRLEPDQVHRGGGFRNHRGQAQDERPARHRRDLFRVSCLLLD